MNTALTWALTLIGCAGFLLAGRKVWWAWYVNIGNQILWTIYAIVTRQWAFLFGIPIYLSVFIPNAIRWTRERNEQAPPRRLVVGDTIDGYCGFCGRPGHRAKDCTAMTQKEQPIQWEDPR